MEGMPIIKPGLYTGVYHEMYGLFKREVILVEYRKYILPADEGDRERVWKQISREIFDCPGKHKDPHRVCESVQEQVESQKKDSSSSSETPVVFVVGRKVTGDVHVHMRQLTFGALVHPQFQRPGDDFPR